MKLLETDLQGVFIIENFFMSDERGSFTKTFNVDFFEKNNLCTQFKESYFSISQKNVIRGMHFQIPPYDHEKLVYVPKGEVLDVVLDLRKSSKSFGKSISVHLSESNHRAIYIPKGLAHGFKSLSDETITVYNVSTVHNKDADCGVNYNSFGFNWGDDNFILSERDSNLMSFNEFISKDVFN